MPNGMSFDFEERIWTIPAERMKSGVTHRVPLTEAMIDVLESVKGLDPIWVFKKGRGSGPLACNALGRVLKKIKAGDCVPHGFRSTFRTWAADATDFPREVCEMALAHGLRDRVEAAYNRAELIDKRRRLMQQWNDFLQSTIEQQRAA
ncbi:site-specific integrase [Pseudomonas aeruginosa]|uniref:tyrosine-type recombinase/integrase n=1 Tax=Pseudomonas aeruginosa TaxID=287 RepID=UPI001AD9B1BA|nr:site-specific integrase [Pseudomonas aeruginosa]MBO8341559.1 site-specific integrase [Pseudomonas aeruginosa]MBO8342406.1 site-specific integrase [Pseudomonas aeruginosa]MBO8344015.1 site-specific integrase [Pseudomonas aeruginosa]MBO8344025.1 site-specific integrase [Pseudomonas aeruginosa]